MASKIRSTTDWMGDLPEYLHEKPLINLCIPGSHDSFSWALDRCGPIGNDQPAWLQFVAKLFPPLKRIVYNWSQCQKLSLQEQLANGVRYFDLRLTCQCDSIRTIHGLCGEDLESVVEEVQTFLANHPKEIVLLDFNHFYHMKWSDHQRAVRLLLNSFGSKCCPMPPFTQLKSLNLKTFWKFGWQLIIFYQVNFEALESLISSIPCQEMLSGMPYLLWTSRFIKSPWPNTNRMDTLIDYLECTLSHKKEILPCGGFLVTQGLLTPKTMDVVTRPFSTLRDRMGIPVVKAIIDWLDRRGKAIKPDLNIVITDFVETEDFCSKVIALNL